MSLLIKLMDAVLLLTTVDVLPIILRLYLLFKLLSHVKRTIFSENLAGKVVLITAASSGIGEVCTEFFVFFEMKFLVMNPPMGRIG